ncbi:glucokinase [Sphingomonas jejuensis]|uniref:Glucokinase n=1 Tax=Sphingomonas jejuensis TaxID=904715 RepID=A0ABX0XI75_9SPHN|nr:glucokinase [Sphingomonas jejuensis]
MENKDVTGMEAAAAKVGSDAPGGAVEIVAVDVGGTNARFARAWLRPGRAPELGTVRRYKAERHDSLEAAWNHFRADDGAALPPFASVAVAAPIGEPVVRFTNSPWTFRPDTLAERLGLRTMHLSNDFGAMAHAVATLDEGQLAPICGPDGAIPDEGVTTVIGVGTGLGVAILLKRDGHTHVIETEGGHIDFAALDPFEARMSDAMRKQYLRVSAERVVAGPGLAAIRTAIAATEGAAIAQLDDATLWERAIDGSDPFAARALERFAMSYGSVAGDLALAHGSNSVVLVGGLSNRIIDRLRSTDFVARFTAKGRWQPRMSAIRVRLATVDELGLVGAAAGFAAHHPELLAG